MRQWRLLRDHISLSEGYTQGQMFQLYMAFSAQGFSHDTLKRDTSLDVRRGDAAVAEHFK